MRQTVRILCWGLLGIIVLATVGAWAWVRWLGPEAEAPYALVADGLYVGESVAEPPPGTAAVVNLCGTKDPYEMEAHLWKPIFEGAEAPDLEWLREVIEFIDTQRRAGKTVYVHCRSGMSRSGMVVTAYLMYKHSWPRDRALAVVQSKRSRIQPNPRLMRLLLEWEQADPGRERRNVMDVQTLTRFFMWCTIVNGALLAFWTIMMIVAADLVHRTQNKWFPIRREIFNVVIYSFLGLFKILFLIFNVVPYVALLIVG